MSDNLPFVTLKIGDEEYKLKINTQSAIELEKRTDKSLVDGMSDFGKVGVLTEYLHAALQAYNTGFDRKKTVELYDDYISAGGDIDGMQNIILEVLIVSGFLRRPQVENLRAQLEKIAALAGQQPT